jgi:hypothetical protein
VTLINARFLPFLEGTKARVDVVKIEAEVELLGAELGGGGGGELRVKAGLSSGVKSYNVWALMALSSEQRSV